MCAVALSNVIGSNHLAVAVLVLGKNVSVRIYSYNMHDICSSNLPLLSVIGRTVYRVY